MESTAVSSIAKRILLSVAGLLLCGACAEYPEGADVRRERFGWIFTNFSVDMPSFKLSEDGVHEYRFSRVSFHGGEAIVYFVVHVPSPVAIESLDTIVTIEIFDVRSEDYLVYRNSDPLNVILSRAKGTPRNAWELSGFDRRNPRTHLDGEEFFVADDFAELPRWKDYRLKVVVAHPEVNDALSDASAFVRLSSTSK